MAAPKLDSGLVTYDSAYAKAVRDVAANISDGRFVAGESWPTVWVRDASYAIDLGCGLLHPSVSRVTLRGVAADGVWTQDRSAHFGGWPRLTDSIVGAVGRVRPERPVRDSGDGMNGPFETLNAPNGPFETSAMARTGRSRHRVSAAVPQRTLRVRAGRCAPGPRSGLRPPGFAEQPTPGEDHR